MLARTTLTTALTAVIVVGTLSGCVHDAPADDAPAWAAEFDEAYSQATDPFIRGVLEDGTITDQEHAEMWERFVTCMAAAEITVVAGSGGEYSFTFPESVGPDSAHEVSTRCSTESGEYPISALYFWMKRNPDNLDENEIMASCLVRKEAVAEGYTAEDFARDNETQSYPYLDEKQGEITMAECAADPLGLLE